ncbi:MAG: putative Ribokinase [Candidatus Saccharibacteria bacterium]|jgi:sugar/nucleoside kinase (ribokinase family)|nr:putative Ribokinase [Candidatus Saccharibacteria bacterium]
MAEVNVKILTIGAATQDVFLSGKSIHARRDVRTRDYVEQFPLGAKVEIDSVVFDTGGGATNAAVTFARQGLQVGYIGKIGHDPAGAEVIRVLRREGVATDRVVQDPKLSTGYSAILLATNGERTILNHRGASQEIKVKEVAIRTIEADWLYISSLAGNFALLEKLLKHANNHGIQVAIDPGHGELSQPKKLKALLPLITVLKANAEELRSLFGGEDLRDTIVRAADACPYVVGTNGAAGSYAAAAGKLYQAGQYQKVKVLDRTGAGDAFGSGFIAALAKGLPIEDALTLGSANATGVVAQIGSKPGILKTQRVKRMRLKVSSLEGK